MSHPPRRLVLLGLAFLCAACQHNVVSAFPPGLEPLEADNLAPEPAPVNGDSEPEALGYAQGANSAYSWVHARGYVKAPVGAVWSAIKDPVVSIDRRKVDAWTIDLNVEPYFVSFVVHNVVHSVVTVDFDITWRQDAVEGTRDAPLTVAGRWQKTMGSSFIQLIEGSIVVTALDAQTTGLELIEHLKGTGSGAETAKSFLTDFHASIVARVHGKPLPTY